LAAAPGGGFLPKKAPRLFCFSGVLGGYLIRILAVKSTVIIWAPGRICKNIPLNRAGLAEEPVRNEDLVLVVLIAGRENVGALDGLVKVAEDVIDDDNALGGIGRASGIWKTGQLPCFTAVFGTIVYIRTYMF